MRQFSLGDQIVDVNLVNDVSMFWVIGDDVWFIED